MAKKKLPPSYLIKAYQTVFGTEEGKAVLHHLIRAGNVYKISYFRGDSHESAYREGQRAIVLTILHMLQKDDIDITKMQSESRNYLIGENDA